MYGGWCRRSQPRVAIWFCVAVGECGIALSSNNRTPDQRNPGHCVLRIHLLFRRSPIAVKRFFVPCLNCGGGVIDGVAIYRVEVQPV
ncbi:hypothetical protein TNCV_1606341 [Trichonephila clavipes]|nr:hypothetical protein TNCV_1606341 [Trichonephila clavipes]